MSIASDVHVHDVLDHVHDVHDVLVMFRWR